MSTTNLLTGINVYKRELKKVVEKGLPSCYKNDGWEFLADNCANLSWDIDDNEEENKLMREDKELLTLVEKFCCQYDITLREYWGPDYDMIYPDHLVIHPLLIL